MDLFLLRHAKIESSQTEPVLSEAGKEQLSYLANQMKTRGIRPALILTSPALRASQTADYIAEAIGYGEIIKESWIAENLPAQQWLKELAAYQEFESVMVVGHEPNLSATAEWLLGIEFGALKVKKSTLLWLQGITPPSRGATLKLLLPPVSEKNR